MAMENFSKHQQGIIKRYYSNLDTIQLQKLAEIVGEMYLAEGKKREKLWVRAITAMEKLEVPSTRIQHLQQQDNPEMLAKLVAELQSKG